MKKIKIIFYGFNFEKFNEKIIHLYIHLTNKINYFL